MNGWCKAIAIKEKRFCELHILHLRIYIIPNEVLYYVRFCPFVRVCVCSSSSSSGGGVEVKWKQALYAIVSYDFCFLSLCTAILRMWVKCASAPLVFTAGVILLQM